MTPLESPPVAWGLAEAVHTKLETAAAPLKLADVAKGLPKSRKMKAPEFQQEVQKVLEEEIRIGRAFSAASGKNQETRYWSRDEKQLLRDKALELAATPQPVAALKTKLGKEVKGADGAFVEAVVRELIGAGRLFEHPPKAKNGAPLFGAWAPPPPLPALALRKHSNAVDRLVDACRKLLAAAGVEAEELFETLRPRLHKEPHGDAQASEKAEQPRSEPTAAEEARVEPRQSEEAVVGGGVLEGLILKAVANEPVLSLAELRGEMPEEFRGEAFDEAVLRLADAQRVLVSQDADPSRFSEAERAAFVQDGANVLTTISAWR